MKPINIDKYKDGAILDSLKSNGVFEVSGNLVDEIKLLSKDIKSDFKKFIKLSEVVKRKYIAKAAPTEYIGYQSKLELNKARFESLLFSREINYIDNFFYPKNFVIKEAPNLSNKCQKLIALVDKLNIVVFAKLAEELELEKAYFNSRLELGVRRLRLLAYEKHSLSKKLIGIHRHIDHAFFTLNVDTRKGLYITHKGKHTEYKGKNSTVLYMPGNITSYITGNKISGTLHKVRLDPNEERISIVCLINFRPLVKLKVINENNHKDITNLGYLSYMMYKEHFYSFKEYKKTIRKIKNSLSDEEMLVRLKKLN